MFYKRLFYLLLFTAFSVPLSAQTPAEQALIQQGLVDVQQVDPSLLVELAYSTSDNFIGQDVYGDLTRAYLQPMAARKLVQANQYLRRKHADYRLLIYDAARPQTAQWKLWNALKLPERERRKYVSDPRQGSIHSYGCAVDLTIATKDGKPLDMGTKFDYFGILAYPTHEAALLQQGKLTRQQVDNRKLLRAVMTRAGFTAIKTEWWHFNALSRANAKQRFKVVE